MPDVTNISSISEPFIKATILLPDQYLGSVMKLCKMREEGFRKI